MLTLNEAEAFYRLWGKVHRPERGCWTWRGKSRGVAGGYHVVKVGVNEAGVQTNRVASRFLYEVMYGGPLPRGFEVGHLCGDAGCLKPSHLAMMTKAQNERMKDPHRLEADRRRTKLVMVPRERGAV